MHTNGLYKSTVTYVTLLVAFVMVLAAFPAWAEKQEEPHAIIIWEEIELEKADNPPAKESVLWKSVEKWEKEVADQYARLLKYSKKEEQKDLSEIHKKGLEFNKARKAYLKNHEKSLKKSNFFTETLTEYKDHIKRWALELKRHADVKEKEMAGAKVVKEKKEVKK